MRKDTDPARTPDQTGNLVHIGIFLPYKAAPVRPEEQLPIEVPIKAFGITKVAQGSHNVHAVNRSRPLCVAQDVFFCHREKAHHLFHALAHRAVAAFQRTAEGPLQPVGTFR